MAGPIRVLHAVVNMNRGGAETLLMNLFRNIDRTKVQFDFLTSKPGVFDEEIEALGGKIHRIPYISEVGQLGYRKALRLFFEAHSDYQAVHSHMDKMSGFVLSAARKAGVPVRIAHSHNTRSEGGMAARLFKWYAGTKIASAATDLIACSKAAAQWMFRGRSKQAHILQNGIETERFSFDQVKRDHVRRELGISADAFVVGHVGRFLKQKNHVYLIELFADLCRTQQNAVLLLAGDGPLRGEIETRVRQLQLSSRVRFLGVRSDVDALLQGFDVFVFPSLHEGLPVTLIEAQGAGLPCIISSEITTEVDLGLGLVKFFPLHEPSVAMKHLSEAARKHLERTVPADALARKGYDIRSTARWVEAYYTAQVSQVR